MKRLLGAVLIVIAAAAGFGADGPAFDDYFLDQTLRLDYFHVGDFREEIVTLDRALVQGAWAGSKIRLLDPFDLGRYSVKIIDEASGTLIYSRGFDSYFGEYRTTEEAAKGIRRTYHESALIPLPKAPFLFVLESRDRHNVPNGFSNRPSTRPRSRS